MTMNRRGVDAVLSAAGNSEDKVNLRLANQESNLRVEYLRLTPPQIADGSAVGYANIDPQQDIVIEQSDWSRGAGLDLQRQSADAQNRYALADGVVAISEGALSSGYRFVDIDIEGATAADASAEWRAQPLKYKTKLYAAFDEFLYVLNDDDESFSLIHTFTEPVLSMAIYKSRIYFTFVGSRSYLYTDDLEAANIAFSTRDLLAALTGDCQLIRARNADDAYALVCVNDDSVALSVNPSAMDPVWSLPVGVGDSGAKLLSVVAVRDVLYIGKTNGLWYYDTSGTGKFVNIEPQIGVAEDTERYRSMTSFGHSLFTSFSEGGVWRINNPESDTPNYVNVRDGFNYYAYRGRSGQVRALSTHQGYVFAIGEGRLNRIRPTFPIKWSEGGLVWDDGTGGSKSHRLIMYDPTRDTSHCIGLLSFTATDRMALFVSETDAFNSNLYIFGKGLAAPDATESTPIVRMVQIPRDDVTTYRSSYIGNAKVGWITTQWFDNYYPDWHKILTRLTLACSGLAPVAVDASGEVTDGARIKVEYRTQASSDGPDEGELWNLMGYITENRFQSLPATSDRQTYFADPIKYQRIRFKFTLETDGSTPIQIEQLVIHCLLSSENRRRYRLALNYQDTTTSPTPQRDLRDLIRLKERHDIFKFSPKSERIGWLEERLVIISDIGPDTEGVFGTGDPGDAGQRAVSTILDLIDLP